jgi:uncharacterized protein (TIGR02569 family)
MPSPPSADTLASFGLTGTPIPIPGGRGLCYRIGEVIFKPCDDSAETQWLSQLSTTLLSLSPTAYRLAMPLPSVSDANNFVVNGWVASSLVTGTPSLSYLDALFRASRALHTDLAKLVNEKPVVITNRAFNRYDEADNVTWSEKSLEDVDKVNYGLLTQLQPILDRISGAMRPMPDSHALLVSQVVHMDLLGNVLFEDGQPPGVIDLTLYWRPPAYAEAVMAADGLAWHGSVGPELVNMYLRDSKAGSLDREIRVQLLVRALYWRCLTFVIDSDVEWLTANMPRSDYEGAAEALHRLLEAF